MASTTIPELKLTSPTERHTALIDKFESIFKEKPQFLARSPGRVNLIGEHIDYCGYSVLPMAIEQDILIALSPDKESKIYLHNLDPKFETFCGSVDNLEITKDKPSWYKYALCGIRGIHEHLSLSNTVGLKAVVDGIVPQSAGLSSSSALVCCSALAMLKVNQQTLAKAQLSEICAKCERYIGTEGGGMDQAISLTAQAGMAKHIEFNPLRLTDVKLPSNAAFVVSNSLAEMNKAATPHYNIRVVECRLACQILAKSKDLNWRDFRQLGTLQVKLGVGLTEMVDIATSTLHKEPYTKDECCRILEVNSDELAEISLSANTLEHNEFYLHQRAKHVYSEAQRVIRFKTICDEQPEDALQQLGQLMDQSHTSCRDLYECSHPDLDKLVVACKENGAVGSRMTGAGWGGCAVSLVDNKSVVRLLTGVRDAYYKQDARKMEKVQHALFATTPAAGAAYYTL